MTPEKVAVLVITGVIAVLLSITLMGSADPAENPAQPSPQVGGRGAAAHPEEDDDLDGFQRKKAADGGYRTLPKPAPKPEPAPAPGPGPAPGPAAPGPVAGGRTWKIGPRDTLDRIAREVYGRRSAVADILAANPGLVPEKMKLGAEVRLPSLPAATPPPKAPAKNPARPPERSGKSGPALAGGTKSARRPASKKPAATPRGTRTPWTP